MGVEAVESAGARFFAIRQCAFEIYSLAEDLACDEDDDESWELLRCDLSLKSTFLFLDLNRIVVGSDERGRKQVLTDAANRFFQRVEELQSVVKIRSVAQTHYLFGEMVSALQELIAALLPS